VSWCLGGETNLLYGDRTEYFGSVSGGRDGFAHQDVDFAGGHGHDNPLDGADFFDRDVLNPGHAKVVLDSWLAFPGHSRSQPDHCRRAGIEVLLVADDIIKMAISLVLFLREHLSRS
jgi:hypothetical protein